MRIFTLMTVLSTGAGAPFAQAQKVMAYRCEAACTVVDFLNRTIHVFDRTPVTTSSANTTVDKIYDDYRRKCLGLVPVNSSTQPHLIAFLSLNREVMIETTEVHGHGFQSERFQTYRRVALQSRGYEFYSSSRLVLRLDTPSRTEVCRLSEVEEGEIDVPYYSGSLSIGG